MGCYWRCSIDGLFCHNHILIFLFCISVKSIMGRKLEEKRKDRKEHRKDTKEERQEKKLEKKAKREKRHERMRENFVDFGQEVANFGENVIDTLWQGETDKEKEKREQLEQQRTTDNTHTIMIFCIGLLVLTGAILFLKYRGR